MPTALIADDEPLLRSQLRARLSVLWPELEIVDEASNGLGALALFDPDAGRDPPDVCFLDIHMPGLSGLEVARRIRQAARDPAARGPLLVFVTAFDEHAVEAFEHGAIDYVLKPFESERLAETVERLKERLAQGPGRADASFAAAELDALSRLAARLATLAPARRATLQGSRRAWGARCA